MTNKNKGRKRAKDYKEQIIRDLRRRRLKKKKKSKLELVEIQSLRKKDWF